MSVFFFINIDEKPIPKTNGRYNFKDYADSPSSPSERTKSGKSKERYDIIIQIVW